MVKIFSIIKFRNMRNTVDEQGSYCLLCTSDEVWSFLIRKTSLDELMNFWNILKAT